MSQQDSSNTPPITLDKVFKAMQHWRSHKSEYPNPGIPTKLWLMIFELENNGYSGKELRRVLSLNSGQYNKKCTELHKTLKKNLKKSHNTSDKIMPSDNPINFCEATLEKPTPPEDIPALTKAANNTQKALALLKSTDNKPEQYLDMTTIIVECIRPDGHRLKIHTTHKSIDVVMQTFFQNAAVSS